MLGLLALVLVFVDSYTTWLKPARNYLEEVVYPLHWLADLPGRMAEWGEESTLSRADLTSENHQLKAQLLVLRASQQRMSGLEAENIRLRSLLNATEMVKDRVQVAELIGISPDPLSHTFTINRGSADDVFVGQAVLGADGLMGQVVDVFSGHSRVLLITDSRHALPVQVRRNGLRAIAEGIGDGNLKLRYISPTMDIAEGDLLESSGLGDRYPAGYPVGTVERIEHDPGQAFVEVIVAPSEPLNRRRTVLLVFPSEEQLGSSGK
ncbi:rod shape-determining protein MreC [Porticoccus sp. W117]|uniref:rod shape-determining protein MreC n=1 Tax=Porticoccus sp. W117 TaxID=3054777 RepID=UPI0025985132|nr:rod shape-determining protein MreC [Porticoccus sp. W117]MDM3871730.1 rod shape-determining protein MreC [Porticoccus sp. W117]